MISEYDINERRNVSNDVAARTNAIYLTEIQKLDAFKDFVLDSSVHGKTSQVQIMYKLKPTLTSRDGQRGYEFLIEYDTSTPSVGIYYGVKGLIYGGDYSDQERTFREEWTYVSNEICQILNNVFPGKNFVNRCLPTDNAEDATFWPFWIRLNEDEEITEVATRAVRIIYKVYYRFLEGENFEKHKLSKTKVKTITHFTNDSYADLISSLPTDTARSYFGMFIQKAQKKGYLIQDTRYEKAWRVFGLKDVTFAFLLASIWEKLTETTDTRIPWGKFLTVFLDQHGERYNDNLKKQYSNPTVSGNDKDINMTAKRQRQREANLLRDTIME